MPAAGLLHESGAQQAQQEQALWARRGHRHEPPSGNDLYSWLPIILCLHSAGEPAP